MKTAIIRYPGSNCDNDALRYFPNSYFIWHTEEDCSYDFDVLVIPGGFAFGDRMYQKATDEYIISPGEKACLSPVKNIIMETSRRKIPILGICNGFQILINLGLLSGKLEQNNTKTFLCKRVGCLCPSFVNYSYPSTCKLDVSYMYVANGYGRYVPDKDTEVFLEYVEQHPEYDNKIAGVCNKAHNIYGMMPHPERNSSDFRHILYKLLFPSHRADPLLHTQAMFEKRVNELMHSEHISYKTTRRYLKKLHTKEDWVIQGPGENAGIVDIGDGYAIALRIESHNHPTFINPFEGAATGVGGILRDIFTMGAKPIALLDFLRFGKDENSEKLLKGAIDGISYYGNCIGIPTIGGDLKRCETYNKNPLVNVGCIGILKKENIIYGRVESKDNLLIYIGSRTGKEGVGGAAMASNVFSKNNNLKELEENVQKGDPFLEKLLVDACNEIAEQKLAVGMQDMGAGGLLCASIELVSRGRDKTGKNLGCVIQLNDIPIKYSMSSYDILMSESQERMLLVATVKNKTKIFEILEKWDLEYSVIGNVNETGKYSVLDDDSLIYEEKLSNFTDVNDYTYNTSNKVERTDLPKIEKNTENNLWRAYDSTVGNRTLKGPDKPGSYAVLDIYEINKKLFVVWGGSFDECYSKMKNFEGVKPLAMVNCLNYGHPETELGHLVEFIEDLSVKGKLHKIPVVGGNVSLYNKTDNISIRPTPILMMIGIN
tara:strand:- start:4247 stop:6388 length:2142 start_codon:yes stop_codon:yes gene_type:complete